MKDWLRAGKPQVAGMERVDELQSVCALLVTFRIGDCCVDSSILYQ